MITVPASGWAVLFLAGKRNCAWKQRQAMRAFQAAEKLAWALDLGWRGASALRYLAYFSTPALAGLNAEAV